MLVNDFTSEDPVDIGIPTWREPRFWRDLLLYYCIFSLAGHWLEAGFCTLIKYGIVPGIYDPTLTMLWRDWLYPYPPEGIGFVICVLVLYPFKSWLVNRSKTRWAPLICSFAANTLASALIELCYGLLMNAQYQIWDYRDMFCNFMGQICLQNSLGFGLLATVIVWVVYPFLAKWLSRLPPRVMSAIFWIFLFFYLMLQCLYMLNASIPGVTVIR